MRNIHLVWLSQSLPAPGWAAGQVSTLAPSVTAVHSWIEQSASASPLDGVLFWDPSLGSPNQEVLSGLLRACGDCWHAGLKLGQAGKPGMLDFVSPSWMLACDPSPRVECTSWRLSLRACLVRWEVLRKLGGPQPEFDTLEGAALEMGHRWIRHGAMMRHVPTLFCTDAEGPMSERSNPEIRIPLRDEVRFAFYRFGRKWAAWALLRAMLSRYARFADAMRAWLAVRQCPRPADPPPLRLRPRLLAEGSPAACGRVSVLVPTVDRYPYLRTLLSQLRRQTVPPLEIIIVDQTAPEQRQALTEFADLPLVLIQQEQPGQCNSRNAGLQAARGDYVLFIDDDDEVPQDLIARHLQVLAEFGAEVSSGVADEVGAGPLPEDFNRLRVSDVFPTNNTMIRREVLRRSGLFDLAYDRRQRADGDLGMRVYLAGATMILDPTISVMHHHAPSGGLRKHKARTITYAMSRQSVFRRSTASVSEMYLAQRYFTPRHLQELTWQSALGTFSIRGGWLKRLAKIIVSGFCLPHTVWQLRARCRQAEALRRCYPQIPQLPSSANLEAEDCRLLPTPAKAASPLPHNI